MMRSCSSLFQEAQGAAQAARPKVRPCLAVRQSKHADMIVKVPQAKRPAQASALLEGA